MNFSPNPWIQGLNPWKTAKTLNSGIKSAEIPDKNLCSASKSMKKIHEIHEFIDLIL